MKTSARVGMSKQIRPWWEWEHYQYGFFDPLKTGKYTTKYAHFAYIDFFSDDGIFEKVIELVFIDWPKSCESFLLGFDVNQISWIGQVSVLYACDVSSIYAHGFNKLPKNLRRKNNEIARFLLQEWHEGKYERISSELRFSMEKERLPKGYTRPSSRCFNERKTSPELQSDLFSYIEK